MLVGVVAGADQRTGGDVIEPERVGGRLELGFESVASGPLVRSSYHADQNLPDAARPAA